MASKYRYIIAVSLVSIIFITLITLAMISDKNRNNQGNRQAIAESTQSGQIKIEVLDIAERSYKNKPALAILFSTPLNKTVRYEQFIEIHQFSKKGSSIAKGGLVLGANGRVLYFPHAEPQTKYKIRVNRGLTAANNTKLEAIEEKNLTTRKITPTASFASKGSILPGKLTDGLPIISINVPEVDLQFMRVDDDKISQFLGSFTRNNARYYNSLNKLQRYTKSVYMGRFTTRAQANQRTITHIPVKSITELQKPGIYISVMTRPGHFNYYYQSTHYLVTDIGLHTRVYSDNFQVHARSLKTSHAIPDMKISIYDTTGKVIAYKHTDERGVARFKFRPPHHSTIIAQGRNDLSILSFRDPALDLSEFNTKGNNFHKLETFVYSNRDLFRPGDRVDFSILLRDHDGKSVTRLPLHLTVKRPDGKVMHNLTLNAHSKGANELGYFHHNYSLPDDSQTGKWSFEVRTNPVAKQPNYTFRFNVEEFLPERMKLDLKNDLSILEAGNPLTVKAIGAYLYGAPASNNRIKVVLNRYPKFNPVENLPDFHFGNVKETKEKARDEILDDKLDKKGEFDIKIDALKTRYNSPMAMRVTTSLFESGGRPVTRSLERVIWPAKALIGIRPLFTGKYADSNSTVSFEIIKADHNGQLFKAKNLEVKVIREERDYYWDYSASTGWRYRYTESNYPVHVQNIEINQSDKTKLSFPVEYGGYRVEVKDTETNLVASYRFYAGWNWEAQAQAGSSRPDKVNLMLDKKTYKSGDTINVKLTAPHSGRAVVFIESDRMLAKKELTVSQKTSTSVSFTLDPKWADRHDIYVTSIVYRTNDNGGLYTPNRSIGVTHLPLERESRNLAVKLDLPEKMQPGKKLRTKIKIDNLKNQKAIVTLSAVDHGILNITDFKTPDPNKHFFAKRAYNIEQYDLYGKIIENQQGVISQLRFGGDAPGTLNQNKRDKAKVKTVALFSGPVELNEKGEAEIEFPIPDFNGSLRVMAVAFTEDRYGSVDKNIIVAAPVIAEIAIPRFISPGDKSSLTLDLHNLSGLDQEFKVAFKTNGKLKLDDTVKSYQLKNKEKQTYRFDLYSNKAQGVGKINLTVNGKNINLKRKWELNIRPAYPVERRVKFKILKPGSSYTIQTDILKQLMPQTVDGTLIVSPQPPLDIRNAVNGLLQYPYGCLEQTTSRAFPLVYIDEAKASKIGLVPMSLEKRAEHIQSALTRIRTMQKTTGGFGLWNSSSPEEPWLTPYVLDFMYEAKNAGFSVPEDMLQKGLKNLKLRLGNRRRILTRFYYTQSVRHLQFAADAYAAYVLARTGHAPLGTLRTIYDNHRTAAESGLPLVQLGIALKLQGDHTRGDAAISLAFTKMQSQHRYLGDYGSPERDRGMSYALLARHDMLTSQADKLIFELGNNLKNRHHLSTQDRLAVFLAAHHLSKSSQIAWQAELTHDQKPFGLDSQGRFIKSFNANQINTGIKIKSKAEKNLYIKFQVNGYPDTAPKPRSENVEIIRTLYDMAGKRLTRKTFKVGELLVAHLSIRGNQRTDNAMVVDLLPAGFEIENLNISKGENLDKLTIAGKIPRVAMSTSNILHQEYRDDRFVAALRINQWQTVDLFYLIRVVSPGEYNVPPPFIEDMYNPEWFGLGNTPDKFKVVNISE